MILLKKMLIKEHSAKALTKEYDEQEQSQSAFPIALHVVQQAARKQQEEVGQDREVYDLLFLVGRRRQR